MQDWRKGRRAEVLEINGLVFKILGAHGQDAPVNRRVVELALEIGAGRLAPAPANARLLIEAHRAAAS